MCLLNIPSMRTDIAKSEMFSQNSTLQDMRNIMLLLDVNSTMSVTDLCPPAIKHLPSHQSVTTEYIVSFPKKPSNI